MKAVILAGGKGTRLAPYTTVFPKPLVPLGHRPILDIIIRQLAHRGFDEVILTVGYLAELIQAYFQTAQGALPPDVKLSYVREPEPLGTAGSLRLIDGLDEPFLVMNGDVLTSLNYADMAEFHRANDNALTICVFDKHIKLDLGVIDLDGSGAVVGYREKPSLAFPISAGIYIYSPCVLDYIPRGERMDFPGLVLRLLADGHKVMAYRCEDFWMDIGNPGDYQRAQEQFEANPGRFLPGGE
jgi:NDP-sugar pyrophosphorylase family protein